MAEIINLRMARKRKAREAEAEQAAQNRLQFGRTKAEKDLTKAKAEQAQHLLDGHKRKDGQD